MKLTICNRLKLCFEILTIRSGHAHAAEEKQLSTFMRGYDAGRLDEQAIHEVYQEQVDIYAAKVHDFKQQTAVPE